MTYTPLHCHSEYSLLDGAITSKELIPYLQKHNFASFALTDHGVMGGVVEFYKVCKKAGIKFIPGIEAYITEDPDDSENKTRDNYHLVLLAKNNQGYKKLLSETSRGALRNFYYKPRMFRERLKNLAGDVCVSSACLGGVLASQAEFHMDSDGVCMACVDPEDRVTSMARWYREVFGDDFYLEIQPQDDGDGKQPLFNKLLQAIAKELSIPLIVTSDAHYITREDSDLHELLMAMQLNMTVDEYRDHPALGYGPWYYIRPPQEMLEEVKKIGTEEAYSNTNLIASKCDVSIELGTYRYPSFHIEEATDYENFVRWKEQREKHVHR